MAKWFIRDENNLESGPFTAGEMRRMVEAGDVLASTMVRKDKNDKFLAAKSYKGLIKEPSKDASPADKQAAQGLSIDPDMPTQVESEPSLAAKKEKLDLDTKTTLPNGGQSEVASFTTASLVETQDTERMAISGNGPETVRTEMLKTDATRAQFASTAGSVWLLRLCNLYLVLGIIVAIGFIIIAVTM